MRGLPFLECLDGRIQIQSALGQVLIVEPDEAVSMRLQHLRQAPVEALHHAVGLRVPGLGQPVLNAQRLTQCIELMLAADVLLAPPEGMVSELPAVIRQQRLDKDLTWVFSTSGSGKRLTPRRRSSRSSAERLIAGSMNSRTTASRSSSDKRRCAGAASSLPEGPSGPPGPQGSHTGRRGAIHPGLDSLVCSRARQAAGAGHAVAQHLLRTAVP